MLIAQLHKLQLKINEIPKHISDRLIWHCESNKFLYFMNCMCVKYKSNSLFFITLFKLKLLDSYLNSSVRL